MAKRRQTLSATALLGLTFVGPALGAAVPGTEVEAAALVEGLEWAFEVTREPAAEIDGEKPWPQLTSYLFTSVEPIRRTSGGAIHGQIELTVHRFENPASALDAFEELLQSAHPDTGLTYAWDQLFSTGTYLYRLHAGCTLAEENFLLVVERLEAALGSSEPAELASAACRCGGGCQRLDGLSWLGAGAAGEAKTGSRGETWQ